METDGNVDPYVLYCAMPGCRGTAKMGTIIRSCGENRDGVICGCKQYVHYARKQEIEKLHRAAGATDLGIEKDVEFKKIPAPDPEFLAARKRAEEEIDRPRKVEPAESTEDPAAPARRRFGF